ncbi:MAG: hypothetical protein CM15mP83_2280 [Flavobacteriaceae bacterium]|nr:MAG: hypothetical protein CM15mP83_2280 [Flavobacteriaceae bacterium]
MKKQYGLPTRDEKNAIFHIIFSSDVSRQKVYILYDGQGEGLGGGEMSRFVRQWNSMTQRNTTSLLHPKGSPNTMPNTQINIQKQKAYVSVWQ